DAHELEEKIGAEQRGDLAGAVVRGRNLDHVGPDERLSRERPHQHERLVRREPADLGRAGAGREGRIDGVDVERAVDRPPTQTGMAPSAITALTRASIAASVRSIEIGTVSTSPQSAMRSRSNGCTLRTGFHGRISEDCSRTARGPKRAPVRYEVPPSYGIPSRATSRPFAEPAAGSSMNVATCPNRGETNASRGPDVLTANLLDS